MEPVNLVRRLLVKVEGLVLGIHGGVVSTKKREGKGVGSRKHLVHVPLCLGLFFLVGGCATAPYKDYYAARQAYETKAPMVRAVNPKKYEEYHSLFVRMQQEMDQKHWRKAKRLAKKIQKLDAGLSEGPQEPTQEPDKAGLTQ